MTTVDRKYLVDFEELGKGAFGIVYKGTSKQDGRKIAAKRVQYLNAEHLINVHSRKTAYTELQIFKELKKHKNIVELLHYHDDGSSFWFIMEFCDLGDLPTYFRKHHTVLNFYEKLKIMVECASAITFMHSRHPPIVHRDIKPKNVLMKSICGGIEHVAKITDFGVGKLYRTDGPTLHLTMNSEEGTANFWAPEFFLKDGEPLSYKPSVDTFALGLLFHVIVMYTEDNVHMCPGKLSLVLNKIIILLLFLVALVKLKKYIVQELP